MRSSALPIPQDGSANVYDATTDAYVTDIQLDEKVVTESPYHQMKLNLQTPKVVLDPFAPDYRNLFLEKGTVFAPDEILHETRPLALSIPLQQREEFTGPDSLPDSDLTRAIHYYASSSRMPRHSMDETALLALGILLEQWAEEEIGASNPLLFLEPDALLDLLEYAAPGGDNQDGDSSSETLSDDSSNEGSVATSSERSSPRWSGEDSDIMSINLLESDTASEVEGGRYFKRRTPHLVAKSTRNKDADSALSESEDSSEESTSSSENSTHLRDSSDSDFGLEGFGALRKSNFPGMQQGLTVDTKSTLIEGGDVSSSSDSEANPSRTRDIHSDLNEPRFRTPSPVKPTLNSVDSSNNE